MSQLNPLKCNKEEFIKLINTIAARNAWGVVINSRILKELESNGLPFTKINSIKYYNILEFAVYVLMRYTTANEKEHKPLFESYKNKLIDEIMINN